MHKGGSNTYYWADQFGAVSMSLEGQRQNVVPPCLMRGVAMDDLLADEQTMEFLNSNGNWGEQQAPDREYVRSQI